MMSLDKGTVETRYVALAMARSLQMVRAREAH